MTTIAENEVHLLEAFRALDPDVANRVVTWVTRLRNLEKSGGVDWSDTWTEEDLSDARKASLSRFEEREHDNA